jgi:hypothetical protein
MFNEPLTDPTAGERARRLRADPKRPEPILDPTDPRSGAAPWPTRQRPEAEEMTPRRPTRRRPATET